MNTLTDVILSFLTYLAAFIIIVFIYIINIIIFPMARVPFKKKKKFKLKVMLRLIYIACPYRDVAEELLGNKLLFFSKDKNKNVPFYLYIKKSEFQRLPKELIYVKSLDEMNKQNKTIIIDVEARESLLCGYTSAKILKYEIVNEKPEFTK